MKTEEIEIQLSEKYLTIITKSSNKDIHLIRESYSAKGELWLLTFENKRYGIWFDVSFPDLLQARTKWRNRTNSYKVRIPLIQKTLLTDCVIYLENPDYKRKKWISRYWKNKLKYKDHGLPFQNPYKDHKEWSSDKYPG